jgi:hypothetical protein
MSRSKFLVRMLIAGALALTGVVMIVLGLEPVSPLKLLAGVLLILTSLGFNLKATHERLKDIFYGHDMWMVWGGYILLSIIPIVSLLTLAIFFLPSRKFEKKG